MFSYTLKCIFTWNVAYRSLTLVSSVETRVRVPLKRDSLAV